MKRSEQRILTTHVGSLIRPKALLDAGQAATARAVTPMKRELTAGGRGGTAPSEGGDRCRQRRRVRESRPGQSEPGATERHRARRDKLYPAVWLGRDGIGFVDHGAREFPRGTVGTTGHACIGPIAYHDHASVRRDLANLKAAAAAAAVEEAFFTAVAPASVGYDAANEHYASERDYVFAIAKALREEYLEVHKAGFVLQVDDAVLANMYDHLVAQSPQRYRDWAELRIDALNHALEGIPEDRIRYHVCFGSWHVPHVADAQLEDIVDLILKVQAGAYSIEAANVRHEHERYEWQKVSSRPVRS